MENRNKSLFTHIQFNNYGRRYLKPVIKNGHNLQKVINNIYLFYFLLDSEWRDEYVLIFQ